MDFVKIREKSIKKGITEIYPDFIVGRTKDLMARGKTFYAVWDEETGMWSTDEYDVAQLVDKELYGYLDKKRSQSSDILVLKTMSDFSSGSWDTFKRYLSKIADNSHQLDSKVCFSNSVVKKGDYISKRLSYPLQEGSYQSYDEIIGTLYSPEEREKLEWAIGAIISGDSKTIQKFIVLYGDAGAGKSTILNIIQMLFDGYYCTFDAKELTNNSNSFATDAFSNDPLVAIQHDGDLSGIKDNSKLNSIVSHEEIIVNEKFKARYSTRSNCFLFMATNKPVKITDGKSGIIRRLIDVRPSGNKLPPDRYNELMAQVPFELGAIAQHCLDIYHELGKNYYNNYKPIDMMYKTDPFFNFVEDAYDIFKRENGTTLKGAYNLYKQYCDESCTDFKIPMYRFREELKNYFSDFQDMARIDGVQVRSYFSGFLSHKFERGQNLVKEQLGKKNSWLIFDQETSLLDDILQDCKAQYTTEEGHPINKWDKCKTYLADLDTKKLHYVLINDIQHVVVDFDKKDETGAKSFELNLAAASKWPKTYAELSKSGAGIHLHYIYDGDVDSLSRLFEEDVEVKVFSGNSSLRRKLSLCNDIPIAHIASGLPTREKKKMLSEVTIKTEKKLREMVERCLSKEFGATKPSMDFIKKILDEAYENGVKYDLSDMERDIFAFALGSTHQSDYCVNLINEIKLKSEDPVQSIDISEHGDDIVFYDIEVFPNLFLVNWKFKGKDNPVNRMINPTPAQIEDLVKFKLVGFNNRRYDNHLIFARMMGWDNEKLYQLSQDIINKQIGFFGEAYNLSYTDIYEYSSKKQGLKKWEIELGIHHQELGLPWDKPVPEERWEEVAEYCDNDVLATEAVWDATAEDFNARQILAKMSGLSVNDTTRMHATQIIFEGNKKPQLVYTDLSEMFPGYSYEFGKSSYRGEDPGEGGYVYAIPGMYGDVALLDIASMHPTSIEELNLFGEYTKNFSDIKSARIHIKHEEFDIAKTMLNGILKEFIEAPDFNPDSLAYALKIVINSIYGYTTANFDNPFKDPRNVDNIVAKRGALFMINLKHEVEERGFTVAHIKTDSIKIPNATKEIIEFVMDYGKQYGYSFEHEATYDRMCLVNDAVYIARYATVEKCEKLYGYSPKDNRKHPFQWTATGAQFAVPYIFKFCFSKEPIEFDDMCETKSTNSALYLDFNEKLEDVTFWEKLKGIRNKKEEKCTKKELELRAEYSGYSDEQIENEIGKGHEYLFIGKVGRFTPVVSGVNGGILCREQAGNYYAATGTKGYRWMESEEVLNLGLEDSIDISYYRALVDDAVDTINKYGDYEWFVSDEPYSEVPFNE